MEQKDKEPRSSGAAGLASRDVLTGRAVRARNTELIWAQDPEVGEAISGEERRQAEGLELIASENHVSSAVMAALGSVFTNKYAEGYPGRRYYGGQEFTDKIERLAIERAKALFGAKFANVQPLSGAPANNELYDAIAEPGDTILGMSLDHGGHLTHGHPMTASAKKFKFVSYGMKNIETGEIDYEALRELALREKPKILLAGFSAYPRNLDYGKLAAIAKEVGAVSVVDIAHIAGLIAGKALENPFDHGIDVMTTTTHKTLRGPRGGLILIRESGEIAKKVNSSVFPGSQGGPHMHQIAGKAVAFAEAMTPEFQAYAKQVLNNAKAMEDTFKEEGVRMITGGTDNHLILVDVSESFGVSGKYAQDLLDSVGITTNKNQIAEDKRPPQESSGVRLGTPAITTRGLKEPESARIAQLIVKTLRNPEDIDLRERVHTEVKEIAARFPVPDSFV